MPQLLEPLVAGSLGAPEEDSAFARLWRGFMSARVSIAVLLLAALFVPGPWLAVSHGLIALAALYLAAALLVRLFGRPLAPGLTFDPQWVFTIGVDLLSFSLLQFLQVGGINYSPLFALPVLMASVLGSALLALATAAGVTLLLLSEAWVQSLQLPAEAAPRFLQAGLTGSGYFVVALLANQLAARLAREEATARVSRRAARAQAQVNELVIDALTDGVLVVDAAGRVQAANPAARDLLGPAAFQRPTPFALDAEAAWQPLALVARETFAQRTAQLQDLAIGDAPGHARLVHVRTRLTAPQDQLAENICVMFLEDLREMEARLRTEKLAAMGRMSAAVAHEIRNPLAAITQANALLDEDLREPAQRQLSALVAQNARRLAQIVEEILNISRAQPPATVPLLDLDEAVGGTCHDWSLQNRSAARVALALHGGGARVPFEPDHLRRVLVNLLDNALRYAGTLPDSIQVTTELAGPQASLSVWSDGAPLEASVQRHLFEPFFSSESRSSGLGLYICRELCERHGALIGYRRVRSGSAQGAREGNEFFVNFRPAAPLAGAGSFDTIAA